MTNYNPHKIYEIGFIGAGNMAQAIGLAFVHKGKILYSSNQVIRINDWSTLWGTEFNHKSSMYIYFNAFVSTH